MTLDAVQASSQSYLSIEVEHRTIGPDQELTASFRAISPADTARPSHIYYMVTRIPLSSCHLSHFRNMFYIFYMLSYLDNIGQTNELTKMLNTGLIYNILKWILIAAYIACSHGCCILHCVIQYLDGKPTEMQCKCCFYSTVYTNIYKCMVWNT